MPILLFGGAAVLFGAGFLFDKAGEGANDLATGAVKIAVAGAVGYLVLKKTKVI